MVWPLLAAGLLAGLAWAALHRPVDVFAAPVPEAARDAAAGAAAGAALGGTP